MKSSADPFGAEESKTGAGGDELEFLADPAISKVQQPKPAASASIDPFAAPQVKPVPTNSGFGGLAKPPVAAASVDPFAQIGGASNMNSNALFANLGG